MPLGIDPYGLDPMYVDPLLEAIATGEWSKDHALLELIGHFRRGLTVDAAPGAALWLWLKTNLALTQAAIDILAELRPDLPLTEDMFASG
jgi:hypothetical protein